MDKNTSKEKRQKSSGIIVFKEAFGVNLPQTSVSFYMSVWFKQKHKT